MDECDQPDYYVCISYLFGSSSRDTSVGYFGSLKSELGNCILNFPNIFFVNVVKMIKQKICLLTDQR